MSLEQSVQEVTKLEDGSLPPRRPRALASREIGFSEVRYLIRGQWKLIVGLGALFGVLTLAAVGLLLPEVYEATATLTVHPPAAGEPIRSVTVYTSLLASEGVLERTTQRLVREGTLPEDAVLQIGDQVTVAALNGDAMQAARGSSVVTVTGRSESPQGAAAIANAMAETFIEEGRAMLRSTAADSEEVLAQELSPTRLKLEGLEAERSEVLDRFQVREEEISTSWDRRISATERTRDRATAEYRVETRRLMEETVTDHLAGLTASGAPVGSIARSKLLEIVAVRAQLAQTPRVLTLEKAASDETLAELLVTARAVELFDGTLVSEQLNPLYDELSLRALTLESELKDVADIPGLAALLSALERMELERAAGLAALHNEKSLELRTLRRRRSRALEDLSRQRSREVAEIDRQIVQFTGLEHQLSEGLNKALVSRLLEGVEVVHLAARAVPQQVAEPRGLALKTAAAIFLGAMLGLMIALFRSASTGAFYD